jgi:hypothetical protein
MWHFLQYLLTCHIHILSMQISGFTVCSKTCAPLSSSEVSNDLECTGPSYRYQGCYNESTGPSLGRTLPQGLDGRSGVTVEECAEAARSRGFPVFALQGYGQCIFGSMSDVVPRPASPKLPDSDCDNLPCPASAATCRGYIKKAYVSLGTHIYLGPGPQWPMSGQCHLCKIRIGPHSYKCTAHVENRPKYPVQCGEVPDVPCQCMCLPILLMMQIGAG